LGGGGAHILGSPMLFVPFTVPTFPATHHQTTHPAHQSHHQQLQANTQNPVQQPQQLSQLNQLSHLNHQGIVPATTNQPTIHSTSCSPQQQATTPNKVNDHLITLDNDAVTQCKNGNRIRREVSRMRCAA
jgi:hypothetical protein